MRTGTDYCDEPLRLILLPNKKMGRFKKHLKKYFYLLGTLKPLQKIVVPWRGSGAILLYHRVLPDNIVESDNSPTSGLAVSETRFNQQMEYLRKNYTIVSMDQMAEHLISSSKEFLVAITFDDGYKDNLTHALPILELHNIPATIYVTTRLPEGDTWLWWYEIWDYLHNFNINKKGNSKKYEFHSR